MIRHCGLDPAIHVNEPDQWTTGSWASEATPFFERLCPVVTIIVS